MGGYLDDPNRQAVGLEPAWVEGSGGSGVAVRSKPTQTAATALDDMTKDELLAYAQQLGVSPANASMTKDELRAGVDAKRAEGA